MCTRRRPPRPAAALLALTTAIGVGVYGGTVVLLRSIPGDVVTGTVAPAEAAEPPVAIEVPLPERLPVFAVSDHVALRLPSAKIVAVAFHEASYGDATPLRPLGVCDLCRNRTKFDPPPPRRPELGYIVTDTRGRRTAATSAADVVLRRGSVVTAPVTGTVTGVKRYRLYGRYPDVRLELRPDTAPDRRVVMLHLSHVRLVPGERVEASVTRVGVVRGFRFESQVDRYVRGGHPHVHMEVKDPAARRTPPKR